MAALAAAGDSCAAETAADMAWEQLHSGPSSSVLPIWRDAYSMACLYLARLHFAGGEFKEALRVLDMGLIMGGSRLRSDLDSAIAKVSAEARIVRVLDVAAEDGLMESSLGCDECNKEVRFFHHIIHVSNSTPKDVLNVVHFLHKLGFPKRPHINEESTI